MRNLYTDAPFLLNECTPMIESFYFHFHRILPTRMRLVIPSHHTSDSSLHHGSVSGLACDLLRLPRDRSSSMIQCICMDSLIQPEDLRKVSNQRFVTHAPFDLR